MDKTIICLKVGDKYSYRYVNNLYNMCKRYTTGNLRFICFTDDDTGIYPNIECFPPPTTSKLISGWFYKLSFFQPQLLDITGDVLYLDLDVIVVGNIDDLFTYSPNKFCIMHDALYKKLNQRKYNSSVIRWRVGDYSNLFSDFLKFYNVNKKFTGDQDYLTNQILDAMLWPDEWCVSYKLHKCFDGFKDGNKIVVFHGNPKPHNIKGSWVCDYWC